MSRADPGETAGLYGALGGLDELALEGPLFWPEVSPTMPPWSGPICGLGSTGFVARYDLDSHVVPACWYRHNHFVEALAGPA